MTYEVSGTAEDGLAAMRGDCVRMLPHWVTPPAPWEVEGRGVAAKTAGIHGVFVPESSARLIDSMAGFDD
ncbi:MULTISPECIES: hypothetical protein [unclassified Streptomyces]|uniref:hypothetical protein n=1 Tax=unclassified Streptomyces TaxID=2593676 RepID=UPI00278C0AF0|nr:MULTISPECIES: hypothetical protein [unclassified Streptomyces]